MHQFPSTCLELRAPLQPYNDDGGDFYGIVCDNDKETLFQFAAGLNTTVFPPPEQRFANFLENVSHKLSLPSVTTNYHTAAGPRRRLIGH